MKLLFFLALLQLSCSGSNQAWAANESNKTAPTVPAVIVFGDSIVDTGNNNGMSTVIKSNFPPYGIDFPGHFATGRFCNGKIPSDYIASMLGVKEYLPPYLSGLMPADLLTGVTFASGGSGFDPLTSKLVSVISMPEQLDMFREYKQRVRAIVGEERAAKILAGSIYVVCAGSDDVANTYYTTPFRRREYDMASYANFLLHSALSFVEDLINEGAQKIGVVGIPPVGCVPAQRTLDGGMQRSCVPGQNQMAQIYNTALAKEMQGLNAKYPGRLLVYVDIYDILYDIIQQPNKYGFEVSTKGCCGTGDLEVAVLCNTMTSSVCADVSKYVFWDSYHPTERTYQILVSWVYKNYIHVLINN
ncbi:GDSL esterase/lipase EXL3 [Dendrobium catenatum]|uniref:GDSL esterase/lipase EXL3 n=1 Tax=Dendrobium catenatum TaxID=906689 RepID=A0A2I0VGW3_9ASPA|nr:GDSL esterase/lipase EXL3 [Dendrobium catenatum]PKU62649.1 GDSL esterase/lipase EXL3 [Dendrobium catenatum]